MTVPKSERDLTPWLVGESDETRALRELILRLAPSDLPIWIEGETGVGKEQAALALHAATTSDMLKKMLNELAVLHEQLVEALQSSESTSECLSKEITRAVMGLQFQDRVNQQIQHITETLDAIYDRAVPITEQVPARKVAARLEDWREWMQSRSTMESERTTTGSCTASPSNGSDSFGSVELF